jgi:hypothetical protein
VFTPIIFKEDRDYRPLCAMAYDKTDKYAKGTVLEYRPVCAMANVYTYKYAKRTVLEYRPLCAMAQVYTDYMQKGLR